MAAQRRQLECLQRSNARAFVHHTDLTKQRLSQAEALALPRGAMVACGRCGSSSLIFGWSDDLPYAPSGVLARRCRRQASSGTTPKLPRQYENPRTISQ